MRRLIVPAAIAIIVAPLFAGCAPSHDEAEREMAAAVVAANPAIDGALVGYSSSGVSVVLSVRAYIPTAKEMSPEELATVVESGLEALWFASPTDPAIVRFGVVPSTMPVDANSVQQDVERFPETARILGSEAGFPDGTFGFVSGSLELRFGARP